MRILYFTDNNSDHNRRFLEKLATSGHEIFYLSLAGRPNPSYWLPRGIRLVECEVTFPRHSSPSVMKPFVPELEKVIEEVKPDLIHAGAIHSCAYIAALSLFHPMLAMSWGSDILVDSDRDYEWREATKIALEAADGFFCDCDTVLEKAKQISNISDDGVLKFPWGIQRGVFGPQGLKMPGVADRAEFVFICTRSWEPIYGIDVLLKAFFLVLEQERNVRLLLIGHGSKEADIHEFIERNEISDKVIVPGMISGGEMPRYFRSANAYISCARSDGTSISLLEAMATGLPVVVADNPSNREWVVEGKNGFLAEIGSAESFAEKMLKTIRLSGEDRTAISELNQRVVAERADWDKNFPLLLRAYERLATLKIRRNGDSMTQPSSDVITAITKFDPATAVDGKVALLLECAPDSNLATFYAGAETLRALTGSVEVAKQKAWLLAQKLISDEPGFEGVLQLHVMEEIIIRALEGIFESIQLDRWLGESGASECHFRVPSPYIERLRSIQAVSGSSYRIVAPPASSVSTAEKVRRRLKNNGLAGLGESLLWGARRYFPNGARWLASIAKAKRPRVRGGWWFYSTAYTFTNIGLAYEPFVPGEMRYLVDSSETGSAPLVERGKPFFDLYAWASRRDLPSKQAVEEHRQRLIGKIKATALIGEEATARDALLTSEAFLTYLKRILPLTCFHSRIFNAFIEDMKPEGVIVGNAAFEGPLLQLARTRRIPTVLLQHGILGDYYQLMDQPAETLVVRGGFWKEFVTERMRARTRVLNVPFTKPASSKRTIGNGHILFLTAVDAALTHTHESDLREILVRLLKVSAGESRTLFVRVHPMEPVGYYKGIVGKVSAEKGIQANVEYSQGPGLEDILQKSSVAVTYSSTVFLDCLRLGIPIVSFDWHDFAYKNLIERHEVFHFAKDLGDLEGLVTRGARGALAASSDYERFLAPTTREELETFFQSIDKSSTTQTV